MPTRFLLLRHAESTQPHVFNGFESDVPLSPRGERQARAIAPILAEARPELIVSSAMIRAVQTAEPIAAACGLSLKIEPELHERKVGSLSGKTNAESGGVWTETLKRWRDGQLDFAPPDAESYLDVQRRAVGVFERLATDYAGQTIVVISHGHVCRILLMSLLSCYTMEHWETIGTSNLGLNELLHSGQSWQVLRINEVHDVVKQVNSND